MKTQLRRLSLLTAIMTVMALAFTSCDDEDYWYGNDGTDSRLIGVWEQIQANGVAVSKYDTQYFQFDGNGRGRYFYYQNGQPYVENIRFSCQPSVNGTSYDQINIYYANGNAATINYWFTGGNLWMQWRANGTPVTYVYRSIASVPWN